MNRSCRLSFGQFSASLVLATCHIFDLKCSLRRLIILLPSFWTTRGRMILNKTIMYRLPSMFHKRCHARPHDSRLKQEVATKNPECLGAAPCCFCWLQHCLLEKHARRQAQKADLLVKINLLAVAYSIAPLPRRLDWWPQTDCCPCIPSRSSSRLPCWV